MAIRDLIPWSRQENRLFDELFRDFGLPSMGSFGKSLAWPNLELGESDKEVRITAELPGLDAKDVDITVEEGVLTLRGEKKAEVQDKDRGYTERSYGRFERRIGLPRGIERDKANATFRSGVLTITLPKSEAANENLRRIPINAQAA